jgi:hypothetical protein
MNLSLREKEKIHRLAIMPLASSLPLREEASGIPLGMPFGMASISFAQP